MLPEIDFDADTSEINFDFHGATAGCDGQIEFNAQRELDVTFKIDPSCGVYFNQGQLPEVCTKINLWLNIQNLHVQDLNNCKF